MDSSSNLSFQTQPSSGLLRFRSAPISFLANFNDDGVSNDPVLGFQELEDKSTLRINSTQSYTGLPPHYPRTNSAAATSSSAMDSSSYGLIGSNLARQNSSPAGLFSNLSVQNGYATMESMGNYGVNGTNGEVSPRLKTQLSFSQRVPSFLGMLSQISELASESIDAASHERGKLGKGSIDQFYGSSGFSSYGLWNESQFS